MRKLCSLLTAILIMAILAGCEGGSTNAPEKGWQGSGAGVNIDIRPGESVTSKPHTTYPATSDSAEPEQELSCGGVARFSGIFVEDGSDQPVKNVAAIRVTNCAEKFLDMGILVYEIDGNTAVFKVTGLKPGATAWVMESTGMSIEEDAKFVHKDTETFFRDDAVYETKDITFRQSGTNLEAVNNTDRTLKNVVVYYKSVHTDGNYFGGITYTIQFGNLEPGASVQKLAGHFKEDASEIVRVAWQDGE